MLNQLIHRADCNGNFEPPSTSQITFHISGTRTRVGGTVFDTTCLSTSASSKRVAAKTAKVITGPYILQILKTSQTEIFDVEEVRSLRPSFRIELMTQAGYFQVEHTPVQLKRALLLTASWVRATLHTSTAPYQ